eukprot:CAMPEP_0195062068 /NCGR_PEP_ID=MMETSP0448-20130528/8788_1 /TAXON_ID=66468 /ORGANISM="Heterocapsa triquestra, Strain CCMP 448" /LENGTH=738 /DNA_ID=CAMNT_0040092705 /DNA_START=30 /DNA_END=2246 /DNA_ORIENTATION=-
MSLPPSAGPGLRLHVHVAAEPPAQCLTVTGSHQALGEWSPRGGVPLEWKGDRWETRHPVFLPPRERVEFKFVRVRPDKVEWEDGSNRSFEIPASDTDLELKGRFNGDSILHLLNPSEAAAKRAAVVSDAEANSDIWWQRYEELSVNLASHQSEHRMRRDQHLKRQERLAETLARLSAELVEVRRESAARTAATRAAQAPAIPSAVESRLAAPPVKSAAAAPAPSAEPVFMPVPAAAAQQHAAPPAPAAAVPPPSAELVFTPVPAAAAQQPAGRPVPAPAVTTAARLPMGSPASAVATTDRQPAEQAQAQVSAVTTAVQQLGPPASAPTMRAKQPVVQPMSAAMLSITTTARQPDPMPAPASAVATMAQQLAAPPPAPVQGLAAAATAQQPAVLPAPASTAATSAQQPALLSAAAPLSITAMVAPQPPSAVAARDSEVVSATTTAAREQDVQPPEVPFKAMRRCNLGHLLIPSRPGIDTPFNSHGCDGCARTGICSPELINRCETCDFDLCSSCARVNVLALPPLAEPVSPPAAPMAEPVPPPAAGRGPGSPAARPRPLAPALGGDSMPPSDNATADGVPASPVPGSVRLPPRHTAAHHRGTRPMASEPISNGTATPSGASVASSGSRNGSGFGVLSRNHSKRVDSSSATTVIKEAPAPRCSHPIARHSPEAVAEHGADPFATAKPPAAAPVWEDSRMAVVETNGTSIVGGFVASSEVLAAFEAARRRHSAEQAGSTAP